LPFIGLKDPTGVAVDAKGNVYVTDAGNRRVLKLATGSGSQTALPFTGLEFPQGVGVDAAGDVYVTDTQTYDNRVLELAAGSADQTVLPFTGLNQPYGVAVTHNGNVYITDSNSRQVLRLPAGSRARPRSRFKALTPRKVWRWMLPATSTSPTPCARGC
jgi:serine/threonine protein kinase, bacterial